MLLGDFHIHSTFSDGQLSIPEIVDLYGSHGFGAIAVTDHVCESAAWLGKAAHALQRSLNKATFPLYQEILKSEAARAWDEYKMLLIPGVEITKNSVSSNRSAHLVILGVERWLNPDLSIDDLLEQVRAEGGLSIAAHPVSTRKVEAQTYYLWGRREELRDKIDAWEVASGQILFDEVAASDLPLIANSDLHARWQFSSWKTQLNCEATREAVFAAIREQRLSWRFYDEGVDHGADFVPARRRPVAFSAGLALRRNT